MLSKTEQHLLKILLSDFTKAYSIRELSRVASLPYPQIHRSVQSLLKKQLLNKEQKGRSWELTLNLKRGSDTFITVEMERKDDVLQKYAQLKILVKDLEGISSFQFICILFGSYALHQAKKESDIDFLFIIPDAYPYAAFEKKIKHALTISPLDIQITTEKGLLEMWQHPLQLNVGNEILKKHILLRGAEAFFLLRKKHYWG